MKEVMCRCPACECIVNTADYFKLEDGRVLTFRKCDNCFNVYEYEIKEL